MVSVINSTEPKENKDQLKRYADIAMKKAANKKWGVLYLTPRGSLPNDVSLHDKICNIGWKQLASIINNVADKHLIKGSFIEHQIMQFCCHIINHYRRVKCHTVMKSVNS